MIYNYIMLGLSVLSNGAYNTCCNLLGKNAKKGLADVCRLNMMIYAVISLIILVMIIIGKETISAFTLIYGIIFGIVTSISGIFKFKALSSGEMSFTVIFISASMMIPAFLGALFWNESLSLQKVIGTLIIIAASYFASAHGRKKFERGWLIYCILAFLSMGAIGLIQKLQRNSNYSSEANSFLFVAFITAFILCFVLTVILSKKENFSFKLPIKRDLVCTLSAGSLLCFSNIVNLYLAGVLQSVLLFPVQNGGSTVLSIVIAIVIFHEKPTKRQTIAMVIALIALAMLIF